MFSFQQPINLCKSSSLVLYSHYIKWFLPVVCACSKCRQSWEPGIRFRTTFRERSETLVEVSWRPFTELSNRVFFQRSNGTKSSPPSHRRKTSYNYKPEFFMLPNPGLHTESISSISLGGTSNAFHPNQDSTYVSTLLALFPFTNRLTFVIRKSGPRLNYILPRQQINLRGLRSDNWKIKTVFLEELKSSTGPTEVKINRLP